MRTANIPPKTCKHILSKPSLVELQHHKVIVQYAQKRKLPLMHVPNEGSRTHYLDKLKGIWPGMPDFVLWLPRSSYGAFCIELKKPLSLCAKRIDHPTWQQWQLIEWFNNNGYLATVAYGSSEAINFIEAYEQSSPTLKDSLHVAPVDATMIKLTKYGKNILAT